MKQLLFCLLLAVAASCKTVSTFPLAAPAFAITDDGICGTWAIKEDTANRCRLIITKTEEKKYHVQVMLDNNINPNYEANIFFSQVGKSAFLNVPCRERSDAPAGYLLMKVFDVDARFTQMTTCTVNDTTMRKLLSTSSVRELVTRNMDNPRFFYDTVHYYKVKEATPLRH